MPYLIIAIFYAMIIRNFTKLMADGCMRKQCIPIQYIDRRFLHERDC